MKQKSWWFGAIAVAAMAWAGVHVKAESPFDWGAIVERALQESSWALFGVNKPLKSSALGPYTGADSTLAVELARNLRVTLVSSAVGANADMIALG